MNTTQVTAYCDYHEIGGPPTHRMRTETVIILETHLFRFPRMIYKRPGRPANKHDRFVNFPMCDRPVEHIPGIWKAYGKQLRSKNITKAFQVYQEFLAKGRQPEPFIMWLHGASGARKDYALECYWAMYCYSDNFFKSLYSIPRSYFVDSTYYIIFVLLL